MHFGVSSIPSTSVPIDAYIQHSMCMAFLLCCCFRDTSKAVDGGILGLSVFDKGVISLSTSAVRLHSRGGLLRGTLQGLVSLAPR